MGRRGRGTGGRPRGREGVTDSYSMHNNWVRLSACIAPSISPWPSRLRPAETHKHTQLYKRRRRFVASCYTADQSFKKTITPWCLKSQLVWRRSHWQPDSSEQSLVASQGRSQKNSLQWHMCQLIESHTSLSVQHTHTLTFTEKCSIYIIGRKVIRHYGFYISKAVSDLEHWAEWFQEDVDGT